MQLQVVGCSPAWPNPGGAQSGYLVEEDGRRLLLDCGPGVLPRLRRLEGWPRVDAIVITHFHLDHWGDLVPWVWGTMWGLGQELDKPELWLPPGGREELAGFAVMIEDNLAMPFETSVLGVTVTVKKIGQTDSGIVAICVRGKHRQAIAILDLPLPDPPPQGAEWIAAYRHWAG